MQTVVSSVSSFFALTNIQSFVDDIFCINHGRQLGDRLESDVQRRQIQVDCQAEMINGAFYLYVQM